MHEQQKIDEAARFLKRMQDDANDPTAFKDDLSAFLTAARSALQYAHKEMTTHNKPGGQGWWKGISKLTLVGFFQDKRDINVHVRPVPPRVVADTQTEDFLPLA